jgi:hypothetical protein
VLGMPTSSPRSTSASVSDAAVDVLRREFVEPWDIAAIAQGYRTILRDTGGHAPIVLYGGTPAELAESIRNAGVSQ